jgi:hypothetical protein
LTATATWHVVVRSSTRPASRLIVHLHVAVAVNGDDHDHVYVYVHVLTGFRRRANAVEAGRPRAASA